MAQVENHFRTMWRDEVLFATQQTMSPLWGSFRQERIAGDQTMWDTIGTVAMSQVLSRLEQNIPSETTRSRRAISTVPYKYVEWFEPDDFPKLMRGIQPSGYIVENVRYAVERLKDQVAGAALSGTAYGGTAGTTTFAKTTDIIHTAGPTTAAYAGNHSGLSVWKIREARKTLEVAYGGMIPGNLYLAIHPEQKVHLMESTSATSQDFVIDHPNVNAKIPYFYGCNIIESTNLGSATAGRHYAFMYTEDSVVAGMSRDVETHIDTLIQNGHGTQLAVYLALAATRLYEDRVVMIDCEDTIADIT